MAEEMHPAAPERPLAGVRVMDLTRVFSGPYCTMILAELGADVVKIENPDGGDETREWPPFILDEGGTPRDQSGYFFALNRSKRSIAIDLRSPRGREIAHRLAAESDVMVENFTPGVVKRLGVDYDTLSAINPRLIYCSISGFGQTGPYRMRKAYDPVVQALGGVMGLTGHPDGPPAKLGVPTGDISPAMYGVISIVASLYWRERSGRGQYIDVGMLDCQIAWLTVQAAIYLGTGGIPHRTGTEHPGRVPTAAFLTSDGRYIHVACNDPQWPTFCESLGLPDMGSDPRFAKTRWRVDHRREIMPRLQAALLQRTAAEWDRILGEAGIPCGIVYDLSEVFADPHVVAREAVQTFGFPGLGSVKGLRLPMRYDDLDTGIKTRPPLLGEHTREVLAGAGYATAEIETLLRGGVVSETRPE